jgi:uncharacterized cupin superfamily protein
VRCFNVLNGKLEEEHVREGFTWRYAEVGQAIGGEKIGATLYELDDRQQTFPYHYHHGIEEWAYVVAGAPLLRTPDGERTLRTGDLVCFRSGPDGAHALCGPGRILILSAKARPSVVVYPDSDKVGTRGDPDDALNFMRADAVDYWAGE